MSAPSPAGTVRAAPGLAEEPALPPRQRTIARAVDCEGVGLHTGETVRARFLPGGAGTGYVFVRTDLPGRPRIPATAENRIAHPRRTAIQCGDAEVHTVEHLLSGAAGLEIDNLEIELAGPEVPGLDGSALRYVEILRSAGVREQHAPKREVVLQETVTVTGRGGASLTASPRASGLELDYTLDYPVRSLGRQRLSLELSEDRYVRELAPARTFCTRDEAEALRLSGLGLGANYSNTLVYADEGVVDNALRFPDEACRHKLLDLLGDLVLLGGPLRARVVAVKSGHELNLELVRRILATLPRPPVRVVT